MTPDILNALADVIANLRGMYDDTDGETHMPREDSDAICATVTGIAKSLGCKDDWGHVADALRTHAAALARVNTLDAAVDDVDRATNAALLATITAAHSNDLAAASEAASLAFGLLGLDSGFRVRVESATTLTPELPEGWAWETGTTMTHAISRKPREPGGVRSDGCNIWINGSPGVDAEAVRAVLARAGVGS